MYYGFDIGGSKIALGVFNQERRLQWEKRVATPKSSYADFLQAVEALVREADERFDQQGSVGIGIPGMPETADGTLYAANVPAASGRPLRADLSARLGRDFPLLRCGCGQLGCIENYLSGRGFAWLYEHFYQQPLSSPEIVAQWQQHDPRAQAHVERYLDLLAVCLGNILTIVDPDLLVLGGGLSNFTAISEGLAQRLPRHLLPVARVPRIERARHGDAGGMRGAAFLHLTH